MSESGDANNVARMLLLADSKRKDLKSLDSSAPEGESPVDTCVYGPRNVSRAARDQSGIMGGR